MNTAETADTWTADLARLAAPAPVGEWLNGEGLLTERVRCACAGAAGLRVISEYRATLPEAEAALLAADPADGFIREIHLTCDQQPWVFAQTLIPAATLAAAPWLGQMGEEALGPKLARMPDAGRGPLEFNRLLPPHPLYRRASAGRALPSMELWARRATYSVSGHRLIVQEVFLPEVPM
ncbi:MAG: chorismate--pyruvate lyase family protein [Steroidobacteraceae bacterium]